MRKLALAGFVALLSLANRQVMAQSFYYVPPGYGDSGYYYGLNLGNGVGFGYGLGVGFPLTPDTLRASTTVPAIPPQSMSPLSVSGLSSAPAGNQIPKVWKTKKGGPGKKQNFKPAKQ